MIQDTSTANVATGARKKARAAGEPRITEYYNALLRNLRIRSNSQHQDAQSLGVSSLPGCSRTSVVATNLAITVANSGDGNVLLVNTDPRNRVPEVTFSLDTKTGIYEALQGDVDTSELVQNTHIPNLKAISCGRVEESPESFSLLMRFREMLDELKNEHSFIIIDLPIASELTPCFDMAASLDGVVLEVESNHVRRSAAQRAMEQLQLVDANVLGCVFKHS